MTDTSTSFDSDFATIAEWAAMYRAAGIQVVPARHPAAGSQWKIPALSWKEFQDNLVPQTTFDRWYGPQGDHAKRKNMGLITGRASGNIFVVDLDEYKSGAARAWWDAVLEEHNSRIEPETWQQVTGGGGRQLLFRGAPGWEAPTNRTTINVDVRGQGGFAVLPPSLHDSGKHYTWKTGFAPWEIPVCDAPDWLMAAIDKLVLEYAGDSERGTVAAAERTASPENDYNDFGVRVDGREELIRDMVWASVIDWYRECPIMPPAAAVDARMRETYATYERITKSRLPGPEANTIKLEKEGRGHTMFAEKWRRAMGQWDVEVAEEAAKPNPNLPRDPETEIAAEANKVEEQAKVDPGALFEYLDVAQIKNLPDPEWLVSGLVIERALGFIYGPPGCLKTFIALGMGLSFAVGMPDWWGRKIERQGAVVYISSEGQSDLKFRIEAWEKHNQVEADESPFYLIRQTINFMKPEDIGKLLATVQAIATLAGRQVAAVFVDTVSRTLPGADENLQKDMTLFVAACDAVRQRFGATVIGVHHTSRGGNMRGSTVFPGAGDFLVEVNREEGAKHGSIRAAKIKAAEDGWEQHFKVHEVDLGGVIRRTSLVVEATAEEPKETRPGWPDIAMCRRVKNFIAEAWESGTPLSNSHLTRASGRYAPAVLAKHFELDGDVAGMMIQQWLEVRPAVLSEEIASQKTKKRGLKVVGEIG